MTRDQAVPPGTSLAAALLGDRLRGRAARIEFVLAVMREQARGREKPHRPTPLNLLRIVDDLEAELKAVRAALPQTSR